jgi:competence protein ComEC
MRYIHSLLRRFALLAALGSLAAFASGQQLQVHVINVGQGLSVLAIGPTGTRILIDGGNPGNGTGIVKPYLQSLGLSALDYSVMTHWHTDHMGGLDEVFNGGFKPLVAAYDRGDTNKPSNSEVTQYMAAVAGKRVIATIGQVIDLGGGATAQITSCNGQYLNGSVNVIGSGQEENSRSITVVLRYGDFDCYVGGDLTANGDGNTSNVEGPATAAIGQVEVVVSAHHGSTTSSTAEVAANLDPSLVIHSCGFDNPYGHPTQTVTNNWNSLAAARVQWCTTEGDTTTGAGGFTAANGTIVISSDGATFDVGRTSGPQKILFTTFEHPGTTVGAGQIALSELLVDPSAVSDSYGEWFELANLTGQTLDLGGMKCSSGAATFTLASRILLGPGQRHVICADGRMSRNGNVFSGLGWPWQSFALANTSSSLSLKTPANATLETASWGAGGFAVSTGRAEERIDLLAPPSAGNFAAASTAWSGGDKGSPWQINGSEPPTCTAPIAYGTGKQTSIGTFPTAGWSGTPALFVNDFDLTLVGGVPNKVGISFWGTAANNAPFMGGTLWVAPPIVRLPGKVLDATGAVAYDLPVDASMVGATRYYQFWFRDPQHPDGTGVGLSSAVQATFCTH